MTTNEHCMCDACKSGNVHWNTCAVHRMPAEKNCSCDCGLNNQKERELLEANVIESFRSVGIAGNRLATDTQGYIDPITADHWETWQTAWQAGRAPLLARIAELEAATLKEKVYKCTECGTVLHSEREDG